MSNDYVYEVLAEPHEECGTNDFEVNADRTMAVCRTCREWNNELSISEPDTVTLGVRVDPDTVSEDQVLP